MAQNRKMISIRLSQSTQKKLDTLVDQINSKSGRKFNKTRIIELAIERATVTSLTTNASEDVEVLNLFAEALALSNKEAIKSLMEAEAAIDSVLKGKE